MEFSIFVQMRLDSERAHDPVAEHEACLLDLDMVIEADKHNFKYAWVSEHHALTEYSHLSANEVFLGYLAQTAFGVLRPRNPVDSTVIAALVTTTMKQSGALVGSVTGKT